MGKGTRPHSNCAFPCSDTLPGNLPNAGWAAERTHDMTKRKKSPPGKVPKITKIAGSAGVYISSVSRALSGNTRVGNAQRERILKLARERGYVINPNASNLRSRRTQILSVVIPLRHETGQALSDPFFVSLLGY